MDNKKPALQINFTRIVLKPMLESKLKLKKLDIANFKAYKLKDLLELDGFGMLKNSIMYGTQVCDPLKISENDNYERLLISNLNKHCSDWSEWHVCYLTIDYTKGTIRTEVWYVSKAGGKCHREFENKF